MTSKRNAKRSRQPDDGPPDVAREEAPPPVRAIHLITHAVALAERGAALSGDRRWRELLKQADQAALNTALLCYVSAGCGADSLFRSGTLSESEPPLQLAVDLLRAGADPRAIWDDICSAREWMTEAEGRQSWQQELYQRETEVKSLLVSAASRLALLEQQSWHKTIKFRAPVGDKKTNALARLDQDPLDPIGVDSFIRNIFEDLGDNLGDLTAVETASGEHVFCRAIESDQHRDARGDFFKCIKPQKLGVLVDLQSAHREGSVADYVVTEIAPRKTRGPSWFIEADVLDNSPGDDRSGTLGVNVWFGEERALRAYLPVLAREGTARTLESLLEESKAALQRYGQALGEMSKTDPAAATNNLGQLLVAVDEVKSGLISDAESAKPSAKKQTARSARP